MKSSKLIPVSNPGATKKQCQGTFRKDFTLLDSSNVKSTSAENDLTQLVKPIQNDKGTHLAKSVYLLLGSNLGNREEILDKAIELLSQKVGEIILQSKEYKTKPWGLTNQPDFLNLAIVVQTKLSPLEILEQTQSIENQLGRVRKEKWGARLIDIDIMFYENEIINELNLQIPHPLMQERDFALTPLAEIAPDFVHPVLGKTMLGLKELIENR